MTPGPASRTRSIELLNWWSRYSSIHFLWLTYSSMVLARYSGNILWHLQCVLHPILRSLGLLVKGPQRNWRLQMPCWDWECTVEHYHNNQIVSAVVCLIIIKIIAFLCTTGPNNLITLIQKVCHGKEGSSQMPWHLIETDQVYDRNFLGKIEMSSIYIV